MKLGKLILSFLALTLVLTSCNDDDDDSLPVVEAEVRDRGEQQIVDKDSLMGYLETHYYNSSAFVSNPDPSISQLVISKLPEDGILPDPANNTLLIDAVETKTTVYEDTDYEYYILRLNQGGGLEKPNFTDTVRTIYEGFTLDNVVFDGVANPVDLDMIGDGFTSGGLIVGWRKVFTEFNVAESFMNNGDGTVNFINNGVGVMFLPSGLGYFSQPQVDIPSYSNLIFKFELFQTELNDHDNDGIWSHLEDLDNDGDISNDNTDEDGLFNYVDPDDDGDGVLTINEDLDNDGDPTNDDSDNDGIPNYLDADSTESNE